MKINNIGKTLTVIGLTALCTLPASAGRINLGDVIEMIGVATSILEEGQCLTSADGARIVDSERYRDETAMVRTVLDLSTPGWRDNSGDARDLAYRQMAGFLDLPVGSCTEKCTGPRSITVRRLGPGKTIVTIRDR